MGDINGDGKPDLVLAHYNHSGVLWVDFSGPKPIVHHLGEDTVATKMSAIPMELSIEFLRKARRRMATASALPTSMAMARRRSYAHTVV